MWEHRSYSNANMLPSWVKVFSNVVVVREAAPASGHDEHSGLSCCHLQERPPRPPHPLSTPTQLSKLIDITDVKSVLRWRPRLRNTINYCLLFHQMTPPSLVSVVSDGTVSVVAVYVCVCLCIQVFLFFFLVSVDVRLCICERQLIRCV